MPEVSQEFSKGEDYRQRAGGYFERTARLDSKTKSRFQKIINFGMQEDWDAPLTPESVARFLMFFSNPAQLGEIYRLRFFNELNKANPGKNKPEEYKDGKVFEKFTEYMYPQE